MSGGIVRGAHEFVAVCRGGREFVELHRGGRLLWAKGSGGAGGGDVPVPGRRVAAVKLTASNLADITLVDFVVWSLKVGSSGSVLANVGGELHSLYGAAAQAVPSSFSCTGKSLTITLGEGSTVREAQVAVGGVVPVALKASAGETRLEEEPDTSGDRSKLTFILPCRLADSRAVSFRVDLFGSYDYRRESKPTGGTLTLSVSNLPNKSVKWTPYSFGDPGDGLITLVFYSASFDVSFTKSEINTRNSKDIAYRTGLTVSGLNNPVGILYSPELNLYPYVAKRKAVDLTVEMFISEIVYAD